MKEIQKNLWDVECDLRVLTTNGIVRRDGACVMGRGCALEAKDRFPGIEFRLGELIRKYGNRVMRLGRYEGVVIASFPVKHNWKEPADPELIRRSAEQLVALADKFGYTDVAIPRPGCGNGKLRWSDVRKVLDDVLDDRFTVVTFPSKGPKGKPSGIEQRAEAAGQPRPSKEERKKIEGPYRIELRCYGSPDDLGLGRYRSHILEGVYETQELAEEEISIQEPLLQAAEAIAAMVPVPAVATVS